MSLDPLPAWINHTCTQYWSCRGPMIASVSNTEGETLSLVNLILWNQQKKQNKKIPQYQLEAHHWERLLHLPCKNFALFLWIIYPDRTYCQCISQWQGLQCLHSKMSISHLNNLCFRTHNCHRSTWCPSSWVKYSRIQTGGVVHPCYSNLFCIWL